MIICRSTRKLDKGRVHKTGQKPVEVKDTIVYDLYNTMNQHYDSYTKDEIVEFLKTNKVLNLSLLDDGSIDVKYLSRTYSNEDKNNKRLFLYTYEEYAIVGIPKDYFIMSSYGGRCKALFIKDDKILKELDNFSTTASNSNSIFEITVVEEIEKGATFYLDACDEDRCDSKTVFCEII